MGRIVNDKVWLQVVKEVDTDGNGFIDFEEFKAMMSKLLSEDKRFINQEGDHVNGVGMTKFTDGKRKKSYY